MINEESFKRFLEGYKQNPFVSHEWPMENGIYKQYSAFDVSGGAMSDTCL